MVVNFKKKVLKPQKAGKAGEPVEQLVVDALLHCASTTSTGPRRDRPRPCTQLGDEGEFVVVPLLLPLIHQISKVRRALQTGR